MNVFKVKYETEEDGDLYAISIVDNPANGFDFIAMKEQKQVIKLAANDKKKILYGIVLRADQQIYREFEDGTPFMLTFDAPTIERLSQDFMKKGYQGNSTYNHQDNNWLNGTTIVENWIVMDSNSDKGSAIGLPVQQGDWCIGMKLSDELWVEYIETGLAKGFSIDSFVKFEKIAMNKIENTTCENCLTQDEELNSRENTKQENMSMLKKLIKMFSEEEAVALASLDTQELGTLTADAFEIGNIVYDANLQPVLDATFTADNKVYGTDATGTIVEISDVTEETEDEAPIEDTALEADMIDVSAEVSTEVADTTTAINDEVAKQVEDIDIEALKNLVATLQADLEKLTQEQSAVLMENTQLKEMVASTKLKAEVVKGSNPITMKAKEVSGDSRLSAIERITKKINN
jgi:hypothetical protein